MAARGSDRLGRSLCAGQEEGTGSAAITQGKRDVGRQGHGQQQIGGGSGQAKVLQARHAEPDPASPEEGGSRDSAGLGGRSGWTVPLSPAQGTWGWWWQGAGGVQWLLR